MKKIAIAGEKYMKDGVEKTSWVNVGVIGMSQNGKEYVLLDPKINLAGFDREPGKSMVMCSVFDDSNNQQQGYGQQQQQPQQGYGQQQPQQTVPGTNVPLEYQQPQQPQQQVYVDGNGNPIQS